MDRPTADPEFLLSLIEQLDDAATDGERWPEFLTSIASATSGDFAYIQVNNLASAAESLAWQVGFSAETVAEFPRWADKNIWLHAAGARMTS